MKRDPYSELAGLDQRLFLNESTKRTRKHGNQEATVEAAIEPGLEPTREITISPDNTATKSGSHEERRKTTPPASNPRTPEARRTPVSPLSGQKRPARIVERHTYDIFQDQVRWMNRLKLDIEEAYNEKVTINGLVTLAVDRLREDYELNGEGSDLIRILVRRQAYSSRADEEGDGG